MATGDHTVLGQLAELRSLKQGEKAREDGTLETEKDLLDWLKYAQSPTTGTKLGFSKGEVAEMDAQIDAAWRESVEEEVNRRLAARGLDGPNQLPPLPGVRLFG